MKVTYVLDEIDFEWDDQKAHINSAKHGLAFDEACQVFLDPFARAVDAREADDEAREAVVGLTKE